MSATLVAAAMTAHAWASPSAARAGTQLWGTGLFWPGLCNVAMLVAFLFIVARQRERPAGLPHDPPTTRPGGPRASGPGGLGGATAPRRAPAPPPVPPSSSTVPGEADADRPERRHAAPAPSTAPASSVPPVTTAPALLASDAERDAAADALCEAIARGCLDMEEGMARVDAAYRARYLHQLASLLDDVPEEHRRPAPKPARRFYRDLRDFGLLALGAAVALQAVVGVWVLWPVAVAALLPFAFRGRGAPSAGPSPSVGSRAGGPR